MLEDLNTENTVIEKPELSIPLEIREEPPSDSKFIISLITPTLVLFVLVILVPIVIGIIVSFRDSSGGNYFGDKFTLTRYFWMLFRGDVRTRDFWQYTYQTLFFAIVSLIIEFTLGIIFAKLLNKKFRGRGLARATILIPWALPTIASATIFRYEIFAPSDQYGLLNNFLEILSLRPVAFFGPDADVIFKLPVLVPYDPYITEIDITGTMFTAIAVDVWKTTPFLTLLFLAALQTVPEDLDKAADIAGANGLQKFRYITWPLIKPAVGVGLVFRMMDALRVYDAIVVFRDKEIRSLTWYAANLWGKDQEYGLASTVSIMLFLFILLFAFIIFSISKREKRRTTVKKRKIKFLKFLKKEEKSIELTTKDNQFETESDLTFSFGSETQIKEFSESKITWIRIKLLLKKGLFVFSVILMCLFCATPFLWIIIRSFRDPFIPQTEFEYTNITIAIMLILFILALYFIIAKSKPVLFAICFLFMFLFCAAPFIWIIIQSAQDLSIPKIVVGYSYGVVVIMLILLIISLYFIIFRKETTKKRRKILPKFNKEKNLSSELHTNDVDIESDKTVSLGSEIRVKKLSIYRRFLKKLTWIRNLLSSKLFLFCISVILILFIIVALYLWSSSELISFRAFQVVFETSEFTGVSFDRALINGFILSGLTVIVVIAIGSLIAYALAKFDFSGKFWITAFIFSMTSLPPIMIVIPYFIQTATVSNFFSEHRIVLSYIIIILGIILFLLNIAYYIRSKKYKKKLFIVISIIIPIIFYIFFRFVFDDSTDLRNNLYGLILPYSALNLPLAVFVLQAFFREIPEDLWKAAKVDGASNFQIFRKVILPLTMPGIFTCAILVFIASWNELLLANIWLVSDVNHTVPRALLRFVQNDQSLTADWDTDIALMAATSIATIPLVIVVLIFQKKIISGITRGAVKG